MSNATFQIVSEMLEDVCGVSISDIKAETNLIEDLGIDSLNFLDLTYEIDKKFGIKLPVEEWMERINHAEATIADYFVMEKLVQNIEQMTLIKQ